MAIQGLRLTDNFVTNERPENWREGVLMLFPNGKAPLYALTSGMKSRTVDDPTFHWWDQILDDRRYALGANISTGQTTLTLATGDGVNATTLKEGDLLYIENTSEIVRVMADPSSDTAVTVQRGYAGTTAAAVTATGSGVNPNIMKIGSAYEEASDAPTGIGFDPVERRNYTQIFRDTLEFSRTAANTRLRTREQVGRAKEECLRSHSIGIERALWLGEDSQTVKNGKPLRTMAGVFHQIPASNIKVATTDHASGVTFAALEEYMFEIFKYGSSEKMAFCGNRAALTIQRIARYAKGISWNIQTGLKEFGMNVTRLICPFGELVWKTHPLWNQISGGTTGTAAYYGMESWFCVLDMENLTYVNFKDADTKYQKDLQDNGLDGMKSGYLTECSMELHHPLSHYLIKNLVTAAAES